MIYWKLINKTWSDYSQYWFNIAKRRIFSSDWLESKINSEICRKKNILLNLYSPSKDKTRIIFLATIEGASHKSDKFYTQHSIQPDWCKLLLAAEDLIGLCGFSWHQSQWHSVLPSSGTKSYKYRLLLTAVLS